MYIYIDIVTRIYNVVPMPEKIELYIYIDIVTIIYNVVPMPETNRKNG